MSWLLIIPLMIVCLFLNIRVYLAMFIGIIAYFLFFSSVPIEIASNDGLCVGAISLCTAISIGTLEKNKK